MAINAPIKNKGDKMRKLRLLIVAVAIPFVLCGENISYEDLPYDYIDHSQLKITKDNVEQVVRHNAELRKQQKEPDGFFIGIGGTLGKPAYTSMREIEAALVATGWNQITRYYYTLETSSFDGGVETLLGYKWFFGYGGFGLRLYMDYNARFLEITTAHNITFLNFDMLFNFVKTRPFKFGMILGIGYGMTYEKLKKGYCFDDCDILSEMIKGNFGFRFVIYNNSAIEILVQPQYSGTLLSGSSTNNYGYNSNLDKLGNHIKELLIKGTLRFVYTF